YQDDLLKPHHADGWGYQGCAGSFDGSRWVAAQGFAMTGPRFDGQATATSDLYRALLAVSEAIASHRDLPALFHELAGRLHPVVRFDNLALLLHEAEGNTLRLHVLERLGPTLSSAPVSLPVGEVPAGLVFESQQ